MTGATPTGPATTDPFPLRSARTRRFTLGAPRDVTIAGPPGARVVLALRSDGPEDPQTHLWRFDPATGDAVRLVDARTLGTATDGGGLPDAERARRERVREQAGGVTAYTVDRAGTRAACALDGRLVVVDVPGGTARVVPLDVAVFDPRISPDGTRVALHHDDGVSVVALDGAAPLRRLVEEDGVVWGRAEFVAAEEMGRLQGMWWSPCSTRLAVARVDESAVRRVHLADLAVPERAPRTLAYPLAGTPNATVGLAVFDVDTGARTMLDLAAEAGDDAEYLARVRWDVEPLLVGVQPRDQTALRLLTWDGTALRTVRRVTGQPWVELVAGAPAWLDGPLTVEDVTGDDGRRWRALCHDGTALTPPELQVRAVLAVHRHGDGAATIVLSVSGADPTCVDVVTVERTAAGDVGPPERRSDPAPGVHHAVLALDGAGALDVAVHRRSDLDHDGARVTMVTRGGTPRVLPSVAATSGLDVDVRLLTLGERRLRAALVLPTGAGHHDGPLPVVLDPYGGPHAQRVLAARAAHLGSQWLADHGFAVLVVDGRGTPGRGPDFEHAIDGDLAGPALADQLAALDAAAELEPRLDLSRVGIRGWSYGGTLAALAALRRPDRIRCAVVGAPVTDWRLYDTHYTERYLGDPDRRPDAYRRSAVVLPDGGLVGPDPEAAGAPPAELLVVHGLADDNVLAAHSLRLTEALHAAGHPFTFLPLTAATHMASDPAVAARLLTTQVDFLRARLHARPAG